MILRTPESLGVTGSHFEKHCSLAPCASLQHLKIRNWKLNISSEDDETSARQQANSESTKDPSKHSVGGFFTAI